MSLLGRQGKKAQSKVKVIRPRERLLQTDKQKTKMKIRGNIKQHNRSKCG